MKQSYHQKISKIKSSTLNLEDISDDDYAHAINVWNTFNINNLGEYHDLYVKLDTALLADIFENFRDKHIETDKLDPAYFLTIPELSRWACLMANDKCMKNYDKNKKSSFLIYVDANNLYRWTMTKKLQVDSFK